MAYRRDNDGRTPLASDSQANNDAAYEDYMTRHQARYPNSNWEPKTRRMVGPRYNPTPWISPTSPVYPPTPARGPWEVDPGVIYERQRLAQELNQLRTSLEAEPQRRQNTDESPQWEYVPGEGYRQVEPGRRSGANNQHYSRRANEQRREVMPGASRVFSKLYVSNVVLKVWTAMGGVITVPFFE
jgi:hypothetical protein